MTGYDIADICLLTECTNMHDDECLKKLLINNNHIFAKVFYEFVILKIYTIIP